MLFFCVQITPLRPSIGQNKKQQQYFHFFRRTSRRISTVFVIFVNYIFIKRSQQSLKVAFSEAVIFVLLCVFVCSLDCPCCESPLKGVVLLQHYLIMICPGHTDYCSPALPFLPPDYAKHVDKEPRHQQISFSHPQCPEEKYEKCCPKFCNQTRICGQENLKTFPSIYC